MGAHKIKVDCLPQREALQLFEEKIGPENIRWTANIRKLAEAVVEECAGLPLALITIGRTMASKRTREEWEYAVDVLKSSSAAEFPGVGRGMYPTLKFSYDCLPDEKVKSCFLYCSLYPEDYLIKRDGLIDDWIGEGFLDQQTNYRSIRNKGHYIVRSLVDACLLEEEVNGDVKMHDVIRDMAFWITDEFEKKKFVVKAGLKLRKQPVSENWENVTRVSLMINQIENLKEMWVCPNLETLLLRINFLEVIIDDFFDFMPMLRVLDMSVNVNLEKLPVGIAKLVSLEKLNLSDTWVRELPVEMKALEKLKYLNLDNTLQLRVIPEQLISSFSKLQVLKIFYCGCEWPVEEIEHLRDLKLLTITFKSASMLERATSSYKFKSCNVEAVYLKGLDVVVNILSFVNLHHLHTLHISNCDMKEVKIEGARIVSARCFQTVRFVMLHSCSKTRDASWVIFAPYLETLHIKFCPNLEEILSEEKLNEVGELMRNSNLFSMLECISLSNLPKLKTIYREALPFPQLNRIEINTCPILKKLPLDSDSAKGQKMVIEGNEKWWKALEWDDEATSSTFLPFFKPRRH